MDCVAVENGRKYALPTPSPQYIKLKFILLQLASVSSLPFARHLHEDSGFVFSPAPLDS